MASAAKNRSLCETCNKAPSVFFCGGCQKGYCKTHANEHRQELSKQLETIVVEHDQLKQNLAEYTQPSTRHPLMEEIDQWETQSIDKIRTVADDARKQLSSVIASHPTKIGEQLNQITQELTKARAEDNFIEIDLEEWMQKLQKYTKELTTPSTFNIQRETTEPPFIQKIIVTLKENEYSERSTEKMKNEYFERSTGNMKIEDNGQVVICNSEGYSTGRCHGEYSSGQHTFRFKIEQMNARNWMHFGIVSKNTPLQAKSYSTPTAFGWATNHHVWLNGVGRNGYNGYQSDIMQNDGVELFLDCDRRTIRLTNERTNNKHELNVDPTICVFPWQLHIGLVYPNDRVRFLSE